MSITSPSSRFHLPGRPFDESLDPKHGPSSVAEQLANGNGGFVKNFMHEKNPPPEWRSLPMGYYNRQHLPVYNFLARHYLRLRFLAQLDLRRYLAQPPVCAGGKTAEPVGHKLKPWEPALRRRAVSTKRRWGYLVWVVAGLVIAVPEITAAVDSDALPFTTISGMVGHLERRWTWVELIVVAAIVFGFFSTFRVPPQLERAREPRRPGEAEGEDRGPGRTVGGRLTLRRPAGRQAAGNFADEAASAIFALAALLSFALVAVATWAAVHWWDDRHHYHPAYILYGLLGLLWLVIPGIVAFALGADVPFPTLFRSVGNLERWLQRRSWPLALGPLLAWLLAYVIAAGLVILLLHLTLYPYPDITRIINPKG